MNQRSDPKINNSYYEVAKSLIHALELKDPYTSGHSYRVYKMSKDLGKLFSLPEQLHVSL
jgi:HD-GYP domain-containing protein (c-di-GMP phosphodiesterase class II)